eukprot:6110475-Pyramimonas_sp.AAC.1
MFSRIGALASVGAGEFAFVIPLDRHCEVNASGECHSRSGLGRASAASRWGACAGEPAHDRHN